MSRCHVRCRQCEARRVLRAHPDEYLRLPACACGAKDWRADAWMNKRKTGLQGQGCNCSGYWFIHRRGSRYCWWEPSGEAREPNDHNCRDWTG